jgi:hypothetical protein
MSRDPGLNRRERRQSFSNVAINDVAPFLRKIVVVIIHGYLKNGASLPNVIPGAAAPMHGVASRDPGLNRRERRQSFSNIAINDVTPNMVFLMSQAFEWVSEWKTQKNDFFVYKSHKRRTLIRFSF